MLPRDVLHLLIPKEEEIPSIEISVDEADYLFLSGLYLQTPKTHLIDGNEEWHVAVDRFLTLTKGEDLVEVDGEAILAIMTLLHDYNHYPEEYVKRIPGARKHSTEAALGLSDYYEGEIEGALIRKKENESSEE
jgi:hypothetical protein